MTKRYRHAGDQPYSIPDANIDLVSPGDVFESPVDITHPAFIEVDEDGNDIPKVVADEAGKSNPAETFQPTPQNTDEVS